jgi:hypothetical protein
MKKILFVLLLITASVLSYAQTYNNEWIDYSKTYYKFKVGATGLYRIGQPALATAGLDGTSAQSFQLWHNGAEVPLYTSVVNGMLGVSDYLEFYGVMNDGTTDTKLYKYDSLQMSNYWSLYTDTAAYFLTVNTSSVNKRIVDAVNDIAANTLAPEPYCIYTLSKYYKQNLNQGFGYNLGDIINSSSYETAEGWSSNGSPSGSYIFDLNTALNVYTAGPPAKVDVVMAGNTNNTRPVSVVINTTTLISDNISSFNIDRLHIDNVPLSTFTGDAAQIAFNNNSTIAGDNVIVADYQITYPRQFNFGNQSQFSFQLPASDTGNYLKISNFNFGSTFPILYDLTNNLRLTGTVISNNVLFALPPSASARQLLLLSTDPGVVNSVTNFTRRNFVDYSNTANQGDYLIVSNSFLFDDGSGNNNVESYRQYRSSTAGGGYNAKVVDIDQLTDQFAFGVKHHPASVRNFSAYALAKFSVQPKFIFLIGKGLNYEEFRNNESNPAITTMALVPTFGWPASDNLLTATRTGEYPTIPIGRLSAISGSEIANYLTKVEQFELAQQQDSQTVSGKGWMKNIAQITGGLADPSLAALITSYMQGYQSIASDTLFGANVYQFNQNSGLNTAVGTNTTLQTLFSNGLSLLTYFGHSSPNTIEFNLTSPENYNNTGKYPAIIINGCGAGDLFEFDTLRAITGGSLSEKFTFADQKGSIAFIASSSFGLPTELNYVNSGFYSNLCNYMYGQPIGNIMKATMQNVYNIYFSDYIAQTHVEEINLHGDPAVRLNPQLKPDYTIQDSLITFNPSVISAADNKVVITARFLNIGKATGDSLPVLIQHKLPNDSIEVLFSGKIKPLTAEDSIVLTLNIDPLKDTGSNQIIVTLDPNNIIPELSETNNTITKNFTILGNELRPIWPYQYAIVNDPAVQLYASTANTIATTQQYVMEMDTTALFNSSLKISRTVSDSGGVIQFSPGISFLDSTVYYWRVAVGPVNDNTRWINNSFVFIKNGDEGFNQSHYFQYTDGSFTAMNIDSNRRFNFNDQTRDLLIRTGIYPYYNWDQINVNIDATELDYYGCVYNSLQIFVYDPLTLTAWKNFNNAAGTSGQFGSAPINNPLPGGNFRYLFEFPYDDTGYRRRAIDFLNMVPNGDYVSISNLGSTYTGNSFIDQWQADTAKLGSGNSLWHKFHQLGLNHIDSFTSNLPFLFLFKKGDSVNFPIYQSIGPSPSTQIVNSYNISGKQVQGSVKTPSLGSVKNWKHFKWDELASDSLQVTKKRFDIIGQSNTGSEVTLASIYNAKDTDISFINAALYPNLKLLMYNQDSVHAQATQLKYWMLTGDKVPEGAVSPNLLFHTKDTLGIYDTLHFSVAFKNVSDVSFDSLGVRLTIIDASGNSHVYNNLANNSKLRPLPGGDTVIVYYDIPVLSYPGKNQLILDVNPDSTQPEQFHFNNTLHQSFLVLGQICPGSNISYFSGSSIPGNTYQWQVNNGSGYINVNSDSVYSGENSATLLLSTPSTIMYGYKYRCAITNNSVVSYSNEYTLQFSVNWTGNIDSSWENPGNWSCGVLPDQYTEVIIKSGLINYPVIKSSAVCHSLSATLNTSVTVTSGFSLDIKGVPVTN